MEKDEIKGLFEAKEVEEKLCEEKYERIGVEIEKTCDKNEKKIKEKEINVDEKSKKEEKIIVVEKGHQLLFVQNNLSLEHLQ